jgi:hypothetical protein
LIFDARHMSFTRRPTPIGATATVAAAVLPAAAIANGKSKHINYLVHCLCDGMLPYGRRWAEMLVDKGRPCWFDASQERCIENGGLTPDGIMCRAGMQKTARWCVRGRA